MGIIEDKRIFGHKVKESRINEIVLWQDNISMNNNKNLNKIDRVVYKKIYKI